MMRGFQLFLLLLYGGLLLFVFLYQERLLFLADLPGRQVETTPAALHLAYEPVTLTTSDRVRLHGWFLPAARPPKTFLEIKGDHNRGFLISGAHYVQGLADFLTQHLPGPGK